MALTSELSTAATCLYISVTEKDTTIKKWENSSFFVIVLPLNWDAIKQKRTFSCETTSPYNRV